MCVAQVTTDQGSKRTGGPLGLGRLLPAMVGAALFAVLLMAGDVKVGHAALPQDDDPFAGVEVLGAAELAEKRGGFFVQGLGITLNLGANIRSSFNGLLVLETLVQFTGGATDVTHTIPAGVDPAVLAGLTFLSSDGSTIAGIDNNADSSTAQTFSVNGTTITVPAGFQGLVAQSDSGVSAAVNKIASEQFANLVINADPNAAVQQTLNINIDVLGFSALQQNIQLNTAVSKFREALRAASLGALGVN